MTDDKGDDLDGEEWMAREARRRRLRDAGRRLGVGPVAAFDLLAWEGELGSHVAARRDAIAAARAEDLEAQIREAEAKGGWVWRFENPDHEELEAAAQAFPVKNPLDPKLGDE